jgi:hypothetical protein
MGTLAPRRGVGLYPFLAVLSLAVLAVAPPRAAAAEEKANHPDGTLAFRVPQNAKGQRHGSYTAYWPGGKKIREKAKYQNGDLNGARELYDDKGVLTAEEMWVAGRLVFPKSPRMIEAMRPVILKQSAASVLKTGKPTNPAAPSMETLARALARVNTYRYLCDLPGDVVLDDGYINLCQHGSELLVKVGQLTHTPARPAGVGDETYQLGKDGCGRSNLFMGGDAVASVDAYMNDSDAGNIDRLGHRRWVLNPKMAKTGFGQAGRFSAMYSFDGAREEVPDYDYVCFPPRGYCPSNLFGANWAWHVSLNPAKYKVDDKAELAIYPVNSSLKRSDRPLDLDYKHVDLGGFGVPNAIIARPKGFALRPHVLFEVVVKNVLTKDDEPADISYFVSFY